LEINEIKKNLALNQRGNGAAKMASSGDIV